MPLACKCWTHDSDAATKTGGLFLAIIVVCESADRPQIRLRNGNCRRPAVSRHEAACCIALVTDMLFIRSSFPIGRGTLRLCVFRGLLVYAPLPRFVLFACRKQ